MIRTLFGDKPAIDIFRQMWEFDTMQEHESVCAIYLCNKQQLKYFEVISTGSHKANTLNTRKLIKTAINVNADQIVLAHNHINNDASPSVFDLALTELLVNLLKMIDLDLEDHLILTTTDYFSFKEQGLIKKYMDVG